MEAAAAARRRLLASAVWAMKPAAIGDLTATAPIRGDHRALPRAVFDMMKTIASSLRDPCARATSVSEATDTSSATNHYLPYRAGSSTGKGTSAGCLGCSHGATAVSSPNTHSTGPIRGGHPALPSVSSSTNQYVPYGPISSSSDKSKTMVTAAIAPHAITTLSSRPTISRCPTSKPAQSLIALRAFSTNGKPQDVKSGSKFDVIMSKLDSIDNKVTETAELYKKADEKVDRCIDTCDRLSKDVEKLQQEQKGSGDWTSIKQRVGCGQGLSRSLQQILSQAAR